jgi:hypothetical protein
MPLYNFQSQFVPKVESGDKTHTIRAKRKYPAKAGDRLYLYTGLRHKGARRLMIATCTKVQEIVIRLDVKFRYEHIAHDVTNGPMVTITIDGEELSYDEMQALARRDGFDNLAHMMGFWDGRLPFTGDIIHWRRLE